MKDSITGETINNSWFGAIPESWSKVKIGRSFHKIGSGTTPNTSVDKYYEGGSINWLNTGDLNDSFIYETKRKVTQDALEDLSTLRIFPVGSVVIALYGATIGKLGLLKIETTTNQACCVISDSSQIINRYLFYIFLFGREYIISRAYGGGQPNISQDLIRQLYIPAPPVDVQQQICEYLDHQCTIIDNLISKKEQLIERLQELRQATINDAVTKGLDPKAKMKESGVEWLGAIPVQWNTYRLKYLVELNSNEVPADESSTVFKVALENIESFSGKFIKSQDHVDFQGIGNNFKKGDVLFNKLRPYLAKVFLAESEGISVGELLVLSPKSNIHPRFLFYRLLSPSFIETVNSSTYGAKMPRASWNFISNLLIPIPSVTEQIEISNWLDSQLQRHEILTQKLQAQIDKLKEYRQSLISEAVTGKIDVRDWQPSN